MGAATAEESESVGCRGISYFRMIWEIDFVFKELHHKKPIWKFHEIEKLLFNFTIFLIKDIFLGCRVAKKEPYNKDKIKEDRYNVGAMNLRLWYLEDL